MDSNDLITLQAFMLALVQLDDELPDDLHQAVHRIGNELTQHRPELAEEVRLLVQQHARLNELYEIECQHLQDLYPIQVRARRVINGHHADDVDEITWAHIANAILKADDYYSGARDLLRRAQAHGVPNASGDVKVFLSALQRAVTATRERAIAVLKALEQRPLTIRSLPSMVGLSVDQSRAIVQSLWEKGYVDQFTGNIFRSLAALIGVRHHRNESIDPDTYLTITSKGHFFLHPVVVIGRREGKR